MGRRVAGERPEAIGEEGDRRSREMGGRQSLFGTVGDSVAAITDLTPAGFPEGAWEVPSRSDL